MLDLSRVTVIALTSKDIPAHEEAIRKSSEGIRWGATKLIIDYGLRSIDDWNKAVVYDLHRYVQTDFALLIHADGYVINPDCWREEWLNYDYIGAPWPLPQDDYSYRTPDGELIRVGNSVSLRSKKILKAPTELGLAWRAYFGNTNEDGFLCVHNRRELERHGIKYAPLSEAVHFSKEHTIEENKDIQKTFAFHQVDI